MNSSIQVPAARYGRGHCPFDNCACGEAMPAPCDEFQPEHDDDPWCMSCNWAGHAHQLLAVFS